MTQQEFFDRGVRGVLAQGEPAYNSLLNLCMYRKGGLKCVIGHNIPDNEYRHAFEETTASCLLELNNAPPSLYGQDPDFLDLFQDAHDAAMPAEGMNFVQRFTGAMWVFAKQFDLNTDVLNEPKETIS